MDIVTDVERKQIMDDRTLWAPISRRQARELARGNPITVTPEQFNGAALYGASGGRVWKSGDYMAGTEFESQLVGRPQFELRVVRVKA